MYSMLQVTSSISNKTLSSIDDKLISAGEFLTSFMDRRSNIECLKTFAECFDIIEWIRKDTEGICYSVCMHVYNACI